jgi:EF hand
MRKSMVFRSMPVVALATVLTGSLFLGGAAAKGDGGGEFAAAASAAFTEADADGSGELSAAEFVQFHEILRSKMEALRFAKLDTDGSGGLSKAELAAGRPGPGRRPHGPGF